MEYDKSTSGKKKRKGTVVNSRISVTEETLERVRDFTKGIRASRYDDAINWLLDKVIGTGDTYLDSRKFQEEFEQWGDDED